MICRSVGWRKFIQSRYSAGGIREDGNVAYIHNPINGAELLMVGTAHISSKSSDEVKEVIHSFKPNTVAIELCEYRARKLLSGENEIQGLMKKIKDFVKFPGGFNQKIIHFAIKSFYQTMREAGMEPGKEFKVAMEEASAVGADILLMDQPSTVTVAKLSKAITIKDVIKLVRMPASEMEGCEVLVDILSSNDLSVTVEKLKRRDAVRQLINFMEAAFPSLVNVILHERDHIMSDELIQCEGKIVVVVGMAHMDGIQRRFSELAVASNNQ